jgi:hypothetical protein
MEGHREEIEYTSQRTGLTEPEARAHYHLREAFKALREVTGISVTTDVEPMGPGYAVTFIAPHFDALFNFLARRVLERERPEGWARPEGAQGEQPPPS